MRACEFCGTSLEGRRSNARFCGRPCKMAHWHAANRGTEEGKARERERNSERYSRESGHRRAYARGVYRSDPDAGREKARPYRADHPERRLEAGDVRSERMKTNPGYVPFARAEWDRVLNRHGNRCAYCGDSGPMEMDHVVPISRGGRHALANIVPACPPCNRSKQARFLAEWRLELARR